MAVPALGDDWVATKLRGVVLTLVDGQWVKLERGQTVPDDRVIRTLRTGRVVFQRGEETIELGGETQVQIFDRGGNDFTTVKQYFGTIGVEAEVQNVEHFGVQTPYLAAVVKGTKFVVRSDERGAEVSVERGQVAVKDRDTEQSTTVGAGQSAGSSTGAPLEVSGRGDLPAVVDARGKVVTEAAGTREHASTQHKSADGPNTNRANRSSEDDSKKDSAGDRADGSSGKSGESQGKSGERQETSDESHGKSEESHGKSEESHGKSEDSDEKSEDSHGKSEEEHGKSGEDGKTSKDKDD